MSEEKKGNGTTIDKEKIELMARPPVPKATPEPAEGPKVIPMPQGGFANARRMKRIKAQAAKEFRTWRANLIEALKKGCRLEFNPNGGYRFLIAPRIVHLVWATTIQERIKDAALRAAQRGEPSDPDAIKREAMVKLREEVDQAQEQFLKEGFVEDTIAEVTALEAARQAKEAKDPDEEEEAEAARKLQEMRQEMVREKDGEEERDA